VHARIAAKLNSLGLSNSGGSSRNPASGSIAVNYQTGVGESNIGEPLADNLILGVPRDRHAIERRVADLDNDPHVPSSPFLHPERRDGARVRCRNQQLSVS
jgi:hypothetical protein